MTTKDPLKFGGTLRRLPGLKKILGQNLKRPFIGVTQGGSSRKDRGAEVAATASNQAQTQYGEHYDGSEQ